MIFSHADFILKRRRLRMIEIKEKDITKMLVWDNKEKDATA